MLVLLFVSTTGWCAETAPSAEAERIVGKRPMDEPAVILCVASIDRVLEDVDYIGKAAGLPVYPQLLRGFLDGLNQLKGIDRTRPFGAALYLDRENPGAEPLPILFVPVSQVDDLEVTLSHVGMKLQPADQLPDFVLTINGRTHPLRIEDGYARLTTPDRPQVDLSAMVIQELTADVASDYDIAVRFRRIGIPQKEITKMLDELVADQSRSAERHEGESKQEYELRRKLEKTILALIKSLLQETQEVAFGWRLSETDQLGTLDVTLSLIEKGTLNTLLHELSPRLQPFADVSRDDAPLSIVSAVHLTDHGKQLTRETLGHIRNEFDKELGDSVDDEKRRKILGGFQSLSDTVDAGDLAAMARFVPNQEKHLVFAAATHVLGSPQVNETLTNVLPHAIDSPNIAEVRLDAATVLGLSLHQLISREVRKQDARLYGEDASIWTGANEDIVWFMIGGEQLPEAISQTVENISVIDANSDFQNDGDSAPIIELSFHLLGWLDVAKGAGRKAEQLLGASTKAFPAGATDDRIHATLTADDNQLQLKIKIDEGYLRLAATLAQQRQQKERAQR